MTEKWVTYTVQHLALKVEALEILLQALLHRGGHNAKEGWKSHTRRRCYICRVQGHEARDCRVKKHNQRTPRVISCCPLQLKISEDGKKEPLQDLGDAPEIQRECKISSPDAFDTHQDEHDNNSQEFKSNCTESAEDDSEVDQDESDVEVIITSGVLEHITSDKDEESCSFISHNEGGDDSCCESSGGGGSSGDSETYSFDGGGDSDDPLDGGRYSDYSSDGGGNSDCSSDGGGNSHCSADGGGNSDCSLDGGGNSDYSSYGGGNSDYFSDGESCIGSY